ncbi:MAG: signal peptidase II [Longimicrobiaceae bacterium]
MFHVRPVPLRRRRSDREPQEGWTIALRIGVLILLGDVLTKALVKAWVPLGDLLEVWPGRIALWHVRNEAMMLGLWEHLPLYSRRMIAMVAAVGIAFFVVEVIRRGHRLPARERVWAWAFAGLSLGGMAGNLGERALHWDVTDFLAFRWGEVWLPPGNLADLALFAAIPVALMVTRFELRARRMRGRGEPHPLPLRRRSELPR